MKKKVEVERTCLADLKRMRCKSGTKQCARVKEGSREKEEREGYTAQRRR